MMRYLSLEQGVYIVVTGLWPLLSIRTFQMVTGRKTDLWLVKTVGLLVTIIGAVLIVAGLRGQASTEVLLLATVSAAGLAGVDVVYVVKGRLLPVYLLDALIELIFIAGWLLAWMIK